MTVTQTLENQNMKETDLHAADFEQLSRRNAQPEWLLSLRRAGLSSFEEQGFPTSRDEDWRFTNIAPIVRGRFKPIFDQPADTAAIQTLEQAPFKGVPGARLVFVDGQFSAKLSSHGPLAAGVKVENLAGTLSREAGFVERQLGRHALTRDNAFAALNQALFADGAFIYVPVGVELTAPIHLVFVTSGNRPQTAIYPRNLIIAEANSKLNIIESYLGGSNKAVYFTNAVTELVAGEGAGIEFVKFQDEAPDAFHVATIQGQFCGASSVRIHSFALGARLSRNNIRARLAGEGLECILNGLYLTKNDQLADHHMVVEHEVPHCASHEYFNGILDDKSKGVFHGRIHVHQIAQKTDAKQTNKNLLLSDDATVDTKPQLEIYADDVKCTHGATVGQLNEEAVFYLRSRGLSTEAARRMLIHAFAGEIIDRVRCEPARQELDRIIRHRLEANPHLSERAQMRKA